MNITKKLFNAFKYLLLSLWAFTTIFPLGWIIMNSFKDSNEIIQNSFTWPAGLLLDNYRTAFENNILRGYMNSFIVSLTVVAVVLIISAMAGYILARFTFFGKDFVRAMILSSLMIPIFATIVPVFDLLVRLDLFNKYPGLILPQIAGNLAFAISVLTAYMMTIPLELEEAAIMEGCTPFQVFSRVVLPVAKPSLSAVAVFVFLWSYNDLFSSLIILRTRDMMPINVLLTDISSQYGTDYGLMAAVIVIIVVPILLFYIFAQRYIVDGMTSGAVKG